MGALSPGGWPPVGGPGGAPPGGPPCPISGSSSVTSAISLLPRRPPPRRGAYMLARAVIPVAVPLGGKGRDGREASSIIGLLQSRPFAPAASLLARAPAAARLDPQNRLHQFFGLFLLRRRGLGFLPLLQARQKKLGARRVEHVDQIFGVDRTRASERNSDLTIVLREGGRRAVAVDLDLEIARKLGEKKFNLAVGCGVDEGVHGLHDAERQPPTIGELPFERRGLFDEVGARSSNQGLSVDASSDTRLSRSRHDRREPRCFIKQFENKFEFFQVVFRRRVQ